MSPTRVENPALARLWRVPVYLPYLQPALTDDAVRAAEAALRVRLPAAYVELLHVQNGGYLRPCGDTDESPDLALVDCIAGIGPRFPTILGHDWGDHKEHMEEEGITTPELIDDLVPFCGDGHFHFCFDYRKSGRMGEPCITYVDLECESEALVAPDFSTFVQQLRSCRGVDEIGLFTHDSIELVAAKLTEVTGAVFEDVGDSDHGYRTFRARLSGDARWAWLTPNRVVHGFVRDTDPSYAELRGLLPDEVDRFPEHADCGYFLATDLDSKTGRDLVAVLAKLPFESRRLELGRA